MTDSRSLRVVATQRSRSAERRFDHLCVGLEPVLPPWRAGRAPLRRGRRLRRFSWRVCRPSIPADALSIFERTYPFAWLGILAQAPPTRDDLIYAHHERGFALYSMRSPQITRLYLQVTPDEDLGAWSTARIWQELHARLETDSAWSLLGGSILEKGVTGMRSFVVEPMQYGRLFLAGDAAHIVPPTGAKGMNLAIADVFVLSQALRDFFASGRMERLDAYSKTCLKRVWRAEHFSWWMTSMLHRFPDDPFQQKLQGSQLDYVVSSRVAAASLAESRRRPGASTTSSSTSSPTRRTRGRGEEIIGSNARNSPRDSAPSTSADKA